MCVRIWESDVHTKTVIYCVLLVPIRKTPPLVFRCNADEMFIWSLDLFDGVKSWFERLLKWGMRWVKITLTAAGRPFKSDDTALWNVKLFICKCYNVTVKCTFINKHTHSVLCISFAGTVCECDIVYVMILHYTQHFKKENTTTPHVCFYVHWSSFLHFVYGSLEDNTCVYYCELSVWESSFIDHKACINMIILLTRKILPTL